MSRPLEDRFWEKVEIRRPGECWPWLGSKNTPAGYGDIRAKINGQWKTVKVTHVLWFLTFGEWPTQMMLHSCDNPPCVNPSHLSEGTGSDNKQQEISRGRNHEATRTHCPRGHDYTAKNTRLCGGSRVCKECDRLNQQRIRDEKRRVKQ
jgi:hypothetical protein